MTSVCTLQHDVDFCIQMASRDLNLLDLEERELHTVWLSRQLALLAN